MILLKYAILNLGRKKKQTLFSLLCIAVSSFIVLVNIALVNGMEERLKETINRVLSGQITVYFSDNERINILEAQLTEQKPFEWTDEGRHSVGKRFPGIEVNERIRIGSLISLEEETSYVHFHALDSRHLGRINSMLTFRNGRIAQKDNEITISETVAKDICCTVGDTVLLVAPNLWDYMSDAIAVISGIFEEKGIAVYLNHNGFTSLHLGKELAGIANEESLELVINPIDERDLSGKEIGELHHWFGDYFPELRLAVWDQSAPLLHSIVKVWQGSGWIMQVIFISFSLVILITLTTLVVHSRKKEFGTLLAIGFSWKRIKLLVCVEYTLLCILAVLAGYGLLEILLYLRGNGGIEIHSKDMQWAFMTDRLFPFLHCKNLLYVLLLFLITTLVSTLISVGRLQKRKIHSLLNE